MGFVPVIHITYVAQILSLIEHALVGVYLDMW